MQINNTTQNKEELRIPEDLLERDAKKYLIMRSNLALLKDETGTYIRNTILNDYYMELRKSSQAHQSGIEEGKKAERNEIYRILSEELSVAYPDPRTGFRDMIEMEVDELCDAISKSLKSKKE